MLLTDVAAKVLTRCMHEAPGVAVESEEYSVKMDFEFIDYVQRANTARGEKMYSFVQSNFPQ